MQPLVTGSHHHRHPHVTLSHVVREYKFFVDHVDDRGWIRVFNIDGCEVCGTEVMAANSFKVGGVAPMALRAAGMKSRKVDPDEGMYSELHDALTCPNCCFKPRE